MRALCFLLVAGFAEAQVSGLSAVKRIHVEELTGGASAERVRDMIIASLQRTGLFSITEDPDKADAVLRGSADDIVFTDTFDTSDGITGRVSANLGSTGSGSTARRGGSSNVSIGDRDTTRIQERKHEASASVRLINRDGDVIWSTTQESLGAKFRGSAADVAEKVARQLLADLAKVRGPSKPGNPHALPR